MNTQPTSGAGDPESTLTDRPALDEAHIRTRPGGRELVIDTGADVEADDLDIHPEAEADEGPSLPAVEEQTITGFSEDSRRRLRRRLHTLRRDAGGLFLSLTYHETDPSPERSKRDLDAFWKALRRRFGGIACVWKQEPQGRGVVHFHLLVFGVEYIPVQKLADLWHGITAETSEEHRKSGVDLEPFVNEDGKLQSYLGKYMQETYEVWPGAEEGDPWHTPGRWWGCLSRKNLPMAGWDEAPIYLDQREAKALIRSLLDEWEVDMPDEVVPPTLTVCTTGDPAEVVDELLGR